MSSPEQLPSSGERGIESLGDAARERQAELLSSPDAAPELSPNHQLEVLEAARKEAHESAISIEKPHTEAAPQAPVAHHVRVAATRKAREKAYNDILEHTQAQLPPASRKFSKVIHQPVVEKASNAVGASIARPNAILFGALFAIIISGSIYVIARYFGYALSGFEAIGSFIIGWIFGLLIDFLRLAFKKK